MIARSKFLGTSLVLFSTLLAGCQPSGTEGTNTSTASSGGANEPASSESLSVDSLPAELRHDAYDYYGLARKEPLKMQIKQATGAPSQGEQTVKLVKFENGVAEFTVEHTDGLSQLGTLTIKLDKGGVRSASNDTIEPEESTWELPAGLTPGKTWEIKTKPTSKLKLTGSNKVEGTREVTTPVATYKDALLVTSNGTGEQGTDKFKLTTKMWLVKGRGTVKSELIRSANGKTDTIILEEVK